MRIHLGHEDPTYGPVPLCGQAMWEDLAVNPDDCDCWECLSIIGIDYEPRHAPDCKCSGCYIPRV